MALNLYTRKLNEFEQTLNQYQPGAVRIKQEQMPDEDLGIYELWTAVSDNALRIQMNAKQVENRRVEAPHSKDRVFLSRWKGKVQSKKTFQFQPK